jgi:prophage antirepressor-like protein
MNDIQIFNNPDFGEIRTILIDNEPWFVAKDIAKTLGYRNTNQSVKDNTDEDDRGASPVVTPSGTQNMVVVNESGLYSLIFGSKLEGAKKFKRWVTSEVLPSIRKNGSYQKESQLPQTTDGKIALLAQGHMELKEEVDTIKADLEALKMDLPILPIEAERITEAVKKKGVMILGGKTSSAYNDRGIRQKLYNDLYSNLKYNFGVRSYKSIKRSQCDKAIEIIKKYEPPYFLQERINSANSQQKLDL